MVDIQEDPSLGRIGGFRLIKRLATGGTSDVLLARAEGPHGFERTVVLKRLLSEHKDDPEFARMFTREASAYARLSHPAIVRLFDFFTSQTQLIMVLEYVDGVSLARLMQATIGSGKPLDDRAALFIATRVFDALAAAHAARDPETGDFAAVIHRDINPANILIPWDGHAKLTDFGIAKIAGTDGETKTGVVKGTYGYMAPEQVKGERVTVRTDIYAASLVLWELLAHKKAIQSEKLPEMEVLRAMAEPNIPSLDALRPDLSPVLREAIGRGLEPNQRSRAISAEEMVSVLREHMHSLEEARNALVAALTPLRPGSNRGSLSDTMSDPRMPATTMADETLDETRAVPSAEMQGLISSSAKAPPEPPTQPVLGGGAEALQAMEEPLRRMTPSGLRSVSPVPQPAPVVPAAAKPPPRPAVSREISKATLAGGFHISSPSNPDLASTIEHGPMELSAQHLVPMDATELAAMGLAPHAPPPPPPLSRPSSALNKTMPLNPQPPPPPVSKPDVQMRQQMSSQSFSPAPPPSYAPPIVEMQPQQPAPQKTSSVLVWVFAAGALVMLGAVVGAILLVRTHPAVKPTPTGSAVVVAKPPPSATPRPSAVVAPPPPTPSASVAASAPPSAKPVASAPPVAVTTVAPPVTAPVPSDSSAPSGVDSFHGLVRLPAWSAGRRVWIDGKLVGEGADPKVALCGAREIKIGSSGTEKLVNVPCGGEVDLSH